MIRKINYALAIIAAVGAIALFSTFMYNHFVHLENSKIITELEGAQ